MTPTLLGRWQTRLLLLSTVGILVTLPLCIGIIGPGGSVFLWVLLYVAGFGIVWDVLYHYLQKYRWDSDWPGVLQLFAGIWEGVFIILLVKVFGLPGVPQDLPLKWFTLHYSFVWLAVYIASQTIMRILFPRWRFRGGQWL
ncbi:MAG: hypothetical protein NVS2B14_07110 [Chamaesiphon sp.]